MAQAKAQKVAHADPVKVDSKHYTVEMENEKVRVLRIKYGPHEKSAMHSHPASIAVFLNDCETRFTYPDGPKTSRRRLDKSSTFRLSIICRKI
jgi:quercetin dioxygenase-like cupin family protein